MSTPSRRLGPAPGLIAVLALTACSQPGTAPPPAREPISAEQATEALGGVPYEAEQTGPSLIVPDEFMDRWEPWTGDLDGIVERRFLRVLVTCNSTSYYVDRGRQGGITYEMFRLLEKELDRRFRTGALGVDVLFIPVTRDRLIPALLEGHGDVAAANLSITEGRRQDVDFTTPLATGVRELVVTGPGVTGIETLDDLSGREVFVRASSSYAESLERLNARFEERGLAPVAIVPVDERLETEDILDMVNAGVYPLTVADDYLLDLWSRVLPGLRVRRDVAVGSGVEIAWAVRKDSPKLKGLLDGFVRTHRAGTLKGNVILNRYLRKASGITNPADEEELERFRSVVGLFETYGAQYDLNWLLLVAQAYQESGLDQSKRSPAGAVGIMQLLPSTARDPNVGIADIQRLENNVHAGAKYLRFLLDRYFAGGEMDDVTRHLFAMAAYNAGPARVARLRRRASDVGLDPDRWLENVEVVAAREVGSEPVTYVRNIVKYYFAYRLVVERFADKGAARRAAEG